MASDSQTARRPQAAVEKNGKETPPAHVIDLLRDTAALLDAGEPRKALEGINRAKAESPWLRNAAGVCQIRLGNTAAAMEIFRGMVLAAGGFDLRPEAPTIFKTNFAVALLLSSNVDGFQRVIEELYDVQHPALDRLRDAIQRWRKNMGFWHKLRSLFGGATSPLVLDFPPGDVL
jgi:hypothetical protein